MCLDVQEKRKKRPDAAIYQPGRRSLNKEKPASQVPKGENPNKGIKTDKCTSSPSATTESESKARKKRPEQARYTPKSRSRDKNESTVESETQIKKLPLDKR